MPRPSLTAFSGLLPLALCAALVFTPPAIAAEVTVQSDRILVDGKPFTVHGGAGQSRMGLLKQLGATVISTYGEESGYVLEDATNHGQKGISGFWLDLPRCGFDKPQPP